MVYMYHSFLIHSSADGHLGCFHVLAIINREQHFKKTILKRLLKITKGIKNCLKKDGRKRKARASETRSCKPRVYNIKVPAFKWPGGMNKMVEPTRYCRWSGWNTLWDGCGPVLMTSKTLVPCGYLAGAMIRGSLLPPEPIHLESEVFCRWAKVELDGAVRPIRVVLECKHLKAVLGWTPSGQRQSASLGYVFDLTLSDGSSPPQTHSPPWVPSCFFYSIPTSLIPGFSWILLCFWEKVKMNSSQCCFSRFLPTQNRRFIGPV